MSQLIDEVPITPDEPKNMRVLILGMSRTGIS